jgi:hypothetical protein
VSEDASDRFTEPSWFLGDPAELLIGFLRTYRTTLFRKITGLSDDQLRSSVLPSGWTALQLIKHLAFMERRWIQWGFLGIDVPDPWGDRDPDRQRWSVGQDETVQTLRSFLAEQAKITESTLAHHPLGQKAATGGRFADDPPTLGWIGFHILQEYARHIGHLDVVRELIDNKIGE